MKRVLLDEGVPNPLAAKLRALSVDATAFPNEWKQLSNGKLMDAVVENGFQVLITNDKNIPYQQNISSRPMAVLVLPTNHLRDVLAMATEIAAAVGMVEIGSSYLLERSGRLSSSPPDKGRFT
ncbi:MAG: hypothetical protein KF914_13345 [Rhizobiaceae bacterium]|nr:hypothetical protein [Rhizobiaceae bacterium]